MVYTVKLDNLCDEDIPDPASGFVLVSTTGGDTFKVRRKVAQGTKRPIYEVWSMYAWEQQPSGTQWRSAIDLESLRALIQQHS